MTDVLLGIDVGTSSTKGVITHADGSVIASAQQQHTTAHPRPGFVEHDPETVWWRDVVDVIKQLLANADGPVVALSISGIGPTTLPADVDGRPLRDAMLYGIDTRAADEMAELTERYGADAMVQRSLSMLSHQSSAPKLMWLQRNEPEIWERTRKLLMCNSFIAYRLTGEYVLDSVSAAFCVPMFDTANREWYTPWCDEIAPGLELPRVIEPWEIAGTVTAEAADLTGLPAGIPLCMGTVDSFVESASIGVRDPGDVMLTYGTTMGIAGVVSEPTPSAVLNSAPGVFPGTYILMGPTATSGALTNWLRAISNNLPFEELIAEAVATPPGANGLVALPYFAGERSPIWDADARGAIIGLTMSHTRGHLYRAMLEATSYSARSIIDAISTAGVQMERIVAVGGGTRGGLWTQIVSDVTGLRQQIPAQTMGACYGDCLFAARAAGLIDDRTVWVEIADTITPDPEHSAVYDELYEIYKELYPATREMSHRLAALQAEQGLVAEDEPVPDAL